MGSEIEARRSASVTPSGFVRSQRGLLLATSPANRQGLALAVGKLFAVLNPEGASEQRTLGYVEALQAHDHRDVAAAVDRLIATWTEARVPRPAVVSASASRARRNRESEEQSV